MSTSYPGPDPDDPFARPPKEDGSSAEETAPIRPEEPGYWERLAQQGQAGPPPGPAGSNEPAGTPPGGQAYGGPGWGGPGYGSQGYGTQKYGGQPYGAAPGTTPYPAGYGYATPAYTGYVGPPQPQATTAMVLGLIGLIGGFMTCGLLFLMSPFAWAVGARSRREIRASQGRLSGEGSAQAGLVMGIIGTVLLVLAIVGLVLFVVLVINGVSSGYDGSTTDF